MQTDFHFYCVAVLARAAGFSPDDALVLAYASQYVDDATEGEGQRLGSPPQAHADPLAGQRSDIDRDRYLQHPGAAVPGGGLCPRIRSHPAG